MGNQQQNHVYSFFREDKEPLPGYSRELVCIKHKDNPDRLDPAEYRGCKTLWELFDNSVKKYGDRQFLGTRDSKQEGRPYVWTTYQQTYDKMDKFARGAEQLGLSPVTNAENTDYKFMGIFGKNREEWVVIDLACMRNSVTIVPFFDSLGPDALAFVINQTELTTMCIENNQFDLLVKLKQQRAPSLKNIVLFDDATLSQREKAQEAGLNLYTVKEIIQLGSEHPEVVLVEPKPETIYMFCYTSGTTGDPKGAKMSHSGFVAIQHLHEHAGIIFTPEDVSISYLPLAHIFEQANLTFSISLGYSHGFYSGDPLKLLEDIVVLKPTFFVTVPRILNRVYGKIMDGVNQKGGVAKWLFNKAVTDKTYYLNNGQGYTHKLYDKTVFGKVKDLFGGNLKYMITASAPISGEVLTFFKVALGIHVYEVYGQTESNGPITVTSPNDPTAGHVGGLITTNVVRLKDVVEMGYLSTDNPPRGELQFKGNNSFRGYFKNPEKTAEAVGEDGWTSTGDVAVVFPNGSIKIVDRAKNIFKLCQGEYIAPEKLENVYVQCPLVGQIFVYGDSLQAYLLAVIVPEPENSKKWFTEKGLEPNFESEEFKKAIIASMDAKAKEFNLTSLEKIKKIHLHNQPFTVANDLITPTFKIKRNVAKKVFQEFIDKMYSEPL